MIDGDRPTPASGEGAPRYCGLCGEIFADADGDRCPRCGARWVPRSFTTTQDVATMLTELRWLREDERLDDASFASARDVYERRLASLRRRAVPTSAGAPSTGAALAAGGGPATSGPAGLLRRILDPGGAPPAVTGAPAAPVKPGPPPPRQSLGEWASARQADILLYLGAFILSIAALIFVGYQGQALTGVARFGVLLAYTAGFLALGLVLPRWERVREAGPVFLALGALLVPVNVIALRTQVLDAGTLPDDVLWLLGGALTAALYLTLAARGYGRLYALPGAVAALVAWGALFASLDLPPEWAGAWFVAGAVAVGLPARAGRLPAARWIVFGALVLGTFGLLYAQAVALLVARDYDTAQLPVAYALAAAGAGVSLRPRRSVPAWAMLPALAALTALTAWWSAFGLARAWQGVFFAGAAFAYLGVASLDDPRRARAWAWVAAVPAALALLAVHGDPAHAGRLPFPVTYGLVLLVALAAYLRWRQPEALAALPPLVAAFGAATGWALLRHDPLWFAPWVAAAGLGYLVVAELASDRRAGEISERDWWRLAAVAAGACALLLAYAEPSGDAGPVWHRPLVYALIVAGAAWETYRGRAPGALALPLIGALLGVSVLDALDVAPVWWSYPCLAAVVLALAAEPWWRGRPVLRDVGWQEVLAGALAVALVFGRLYRDHPEHGVAGFAVAAAVYLIAALGCQGALARMFRDPPSATALTVERQMLARVAGALLFAAAGYLNAALELEGGERGWVYAGIGTAAWLGLAAFGRRRELFGVLAPAAVVALGIAASIARDTAGTATPFMAAGAAGAALSFPATRRWSLWPVCAGFVVAALAFLWKWQAFEWTTLPIVYGALAGAVFGGLAPLRRYGRDERGASVTLLTWGSWVTAVAAAWLVLDWRDTRLAIGEALVRTDEWKALAVTVGLAALALLIEGVRLRQRAPMAAGSAGLLVALLLGIAVFEPGNVQAYTLPVGLYLIGLGFAWRRSGELLGRHMYAHEGAMVLGMLVLLLPAAEQALSPGGGRFGLELIAAGLLLLAAGLGLGARWLVVGGVVSLSAVGLRWLVTESEVPYWLTLGVVGMALLAFGTLLLLERDRWDRARARVRRWWADGAV